MFDQKSESIFISKHLTFRPSLGSDDSDEEEHSTFPNPGAMDIDNVDRECTDLSISLNSSKPANHTLAWAETPSTDAVSAAAEDDPWGGSSEAAPDKVAGDQDGWANFCAFTSPPEEAAEGTVFSKQQSFQIHKSETIYRDIRLLFVFLAVKDVENNPGAAENKPEDNNANPPLVTAEDDSELVDNFR